MLVDCADTRTGRIQPGGPSTVDLVFEKMFADLDAGRTDSLRFGLEALQQAMRPATPTEKRSRGGGSKYRAHFMLDSVLLADNLRSLHDEAAENDEQSLLLTVVKQCWPKFKLCSSEA